MCYTIFKIKNRFAHFWRKKYLTKFNVKFYVWRLFFDALGRVLKIFEKNYSFLRSLCRLCYAHPANFPDLLNKYLISRNLQIFKSSKKGLNHSTLTYSKNHSPGGSSKEYVLPRGTARTTPPGVQQEIFPPGGTAITQEFHNT